MRQINRVFAAVVILTMLLFSPNSQAVDWAPWLWANFCGQLPKEMVSRAAYSLIAPANTQTVPCAAAPTGYHRLQQAASDGDLAVDLFVGTDPAGSSLCYAYNGVPEAPVIRIQRGHTLTVRLTNTLNDTGPDNTRNCLLQTFVDGGACDEPEQGFRAQPGMDDGFYPIQSNVPHLADGSTNLHVHGFVVSPRPCHDEVIRSKIYPANWGGPVTGLLPCQAAPNELTYTYDIPADHPEGLYWYHTHRHGQAQAATMLGLVGAIVIEGPDDTRRAAMGVGDDVLVIHDVPIMQPGSPPQPMASHKSVLNRQKRHAKVQPVADPRIDQANEVSCEPGDPDTGGPQVTALTLNGASVPEMPDGSFPPDNTVLTKTMRPGQTEIWRILNASANTAIRPRLSMVRDGVTSMLPLVVLARDGVPVADDAGYPSMQTIDTTNKPILLDPANRLEIVVHAPPPGATLYLDTAQVAVGCAGDGDPARRLLRVVSTGAPMTAPVPDAALAPADPDMYYTHMLDQVPAVQRVLAFTEYPRGFTVARSTWIGQAPQPGQFDPDVTDFYLNQIESSDDPTFAPVIKPFDMHTLRPDLVVHLHGGEKTTEQWTIQNYSLEFHAFHIHQVHFRDISAGSRDPFDAPLLDTVNVPPAGNNGGMAGAPGQTTIVMTFTKAQIGEFVFHCHILEHEDNGMMQKIRVVAD
ncbi:MAG TPA: multicopper oxidase domain-containing protein [Rhodopila sp.]